VCEAADVLGCGLPCLSLLLKRCFKALRAPHWWGLVWQSCLVPPAVLCNPLKYSFHFRAPCLPSAAAQPGCAGIDRASAATRDQGRTGPCCCAMQKEATAVPLFISGHWSEAGGSKRMGPWHSPRSACGRRW